MNGGAGENSGQGSEGPGDRSFGGYLLAAARSIIACGATIKMGIPRQSG